MEDNSKKIILDLCGGTGSWSKFYRAAGYDVRLITLPDCDVRSYIPPKNVYGILAAPPCTEFSIAKERYGRDLAKGLEIVESCLRIIWLCRLDNKIRFWALENPTGYLRQFLGRPALSFEQWQYGDNGYKPTDIWGYFNIPKVKKTVRPVGLKKTEFYSDNELPKDYELPPDMTRRRQVLRAMTPPGFAKAFYRANK